MELTLSGMVLAARLNARTRFAARDAGVCLGLPLITAVYGKRALLLAIYGALVLPPRLARSGSKLARPIESVGESIAKVARCGAGR